MAFTVHQRVHLHRSNIFQKLGSSGLWLSKSCKSTQIGVPGEAATPTARARLGEQSWKFDGDLRCPRGSVQVSVTQAPRATGMTPEGTETTEERGPKARTTTPNFLKMAPGGPAQHECKPRYLYLGTKKSPPKTLVQVLSTTLFSMEKSFICNYFACHAFSVVLG